MCREVKLGSLKPRPITSLPICNSWEDFVRKRLNELHPVVFSSIHNPDIQDRLLYFYYHKELNNLGFGRDIPRSTLHLDA
jgi:hypothetical protein